MGESTQVVIVSVGGTVGWREGARRLADAFERAGARTSLAQAAPVRDVRTLMATDLVQARAARRVAIAAAPPPSAAIVYCSVTAALLWPRPGAIWLDAVAAENRPGRHGVWQRPVERRRLRQASLILTWDPGALDGLGDGPRPASVTVPPPLADPAAPADSAAPVRDIDVIVYGADPVKRRLDHVLEVWRTVRREHELLAVAGLERPDQPGVRYVGRLQQDAYRALLRRARVFAAAPRREDFGIAALEALADGAMLVTTPAPGSYPALALARRLDPRLVSDDLGPALRQALDDPLPGYAAAAAELVEPYRMQTVVATLSGHVLPRLLQGWKS